MHFLKNRERLPVMSYRLSGNNISKVNGFPYQQLKNNSLKTDNRQPKTDNRKRITENRQPKTDNRKQKTDNREPITENGQPTTDNRERLSVMSYQLSVNRINRVNGLSQEQYKNGIRGQKTDNRKPKTDNRERTTDDKEPTTENGYQLSVNRINRVNGLSQEQKTVISYELSVICK